MIIDTAAKVFSLDALADDFCRRWKSLHGGIGPSEELQKLYSQQWAQNLLREGWTQWPSGEQPQASCVGPSHTQPHDSKTFGEMPAASPF